MANARSSGEFYEYATVDTLPDADGYFTNAVRPRWLRLKKKVDKIMFSIREAAADVSEADSTLSTVTVVLQYKCPGDTRWTTYVPLDGSSLATGNRLAIMDFGDDVYWRAGVVSDGYTSGSVTFGFDW
jgi:hypothetical protein